MFVKLTSENESLLKEIIENENDNNYWIKRFENMNKREESILRGSLKELEQYEMIKVDYADVGPYYINILKDGYLYEERLEEVNKKKMSPLEKKITELLERTKTIEAPIYVSLGDIDIDKHNAPAEEWMNDVKILHDRYLMNHPLSQRINTLLIHRGSSAYSDLIACLKSIQNDKEFLEQHLGNKENAPTNSKKNLQEYDVFISHANVDKPEIVEELNTSLKKLGVKVFYDKDTLEWGDNWKEKIIEGTKKSEFAIIVISENFFGREWTEKELQEFFNRQNIAGQKIILPIMHNITANQLREKYPFMADIQAIPSSEYNCDTIALLFAKQFIKRLKGELI